MTTVELPLTDADKRFVLGPPLGWTPTAEPISDTAVTPFGLTLRTAPNRISTPNAKKDPTQAVTEVTSDGSGEDEDVAFDVTDD
ncbi:hypothetical protein H4696_008029 [Amycolatopsis lexingtonensis]|uniref:ATP-grasp-modified RiPP n=1 Tax=Amycolatopsis lexingtonensis TaxID=218822 RepID=A0ABR9ICM0_9PSEU|nr:hypothetical protein [Amycolatopsis lexingtonensis]MBE1500929.1 hypothetical protein [Amycolatopsis lexingtonensis]